MDSFSRRNVLFLLLAPHHAIPRIPFYNPLFSQRTFKEHTYFIFIEVKL